MNLSQLLALALFFFVLLALSFQRTRRRHHQKLHLFRSLFPSWRFFEEYGRSPVLYYRLQTKNGQMGPWLPCLKPAQRHLGHLFLNSRGNFNFACNTLLNQLSVDLENLDHRDSLAVEATTSYQLIKNLVSYQIRQDTQTPSFTYQFRICGELKTKDENNQEDLLISPTYQGYSVNV